MAFFLYDDASGRSTPTIPLFSVESCQIRQGSLSLSSLPSPQRSEAAASRREARLTQQRARLAAHHARVDQVRRAALSSPPKLVRSSDPNYGLFDSPPPGPAQAGSEPPPLDLRVSLALSRAEEHKARRVLKARRGLAKVDAVRERRRWGAAAIQGFARRNFLPPPVPPALVEAFAQPDFTISALTDSSLLSLAASASARLGTEGGGRKLLTLLLVHLRPGLALDDSDAATATASRAAMGRYAAAFHEALTPFKPHLLMAAWTLFLASFEAWRKEDRESLLADLDKSARGAWTVYLTSGLRLACLEGRPDASALALKCKHQKVGSRRHLQRIRTAYDKILGGVEEGRARMKAIKAEVEGSLDEAAVHAETLREAGPTPKPAAASGPSSPPRPAVADVKSAMSNPRLVHRILLTPASELSELTVDGGPAFAPAPSFAEYDPDAVDEGAGVEERIRAQMRKAYFDNVGAALSKSEAVAAFEEVLSTLVEKVCGLAPNRPDLRSQATKEGTPVERLLAVATVLCMLESPARAPTTQELVSFLGAGDVSPADVVKSLRYLLAKAELASLEVANWRLQLTAPLIRAKGRSYEFSRFVESFGPPPCAEAVALHEWTSAFPSPDRASFQENCVRNLLFARDAARAMPGESHAASLARSPPPL